MKLSFLTAFILIFLIFVGFGCSSIDNVRNPGDVEVLKSVGKVEVSKDRGRKWKAVSVKTNIKTPAALRTGDGAHVDLRIRDGSLVRLAENSGLGFDEISIDERGLEIQLDLKEGRIVGIAKPLQPQDMYEVKTPVGVFGVRDVGMDEGTSFEAHSKGLFRCLRGKLVVVFIIDGPVIGPQSLKDGEEIDAKNLYTVGVTKIPGPEIVRLEAELKELRASAVARKR